VVLTLCCYPYPFIAYFKLGCLFVTFRRSEISSASNHTSQTKQSASFIKISNVHVRILIFCPIFIQNLNMSARFSKNFKYRVSRKSVQWEPRLSIPTEKKTDIVTLTVALRSCL
jgi:hypothetical protein